MKTYLTLAAGAALLCLTPATASAQLIRHVGEPAPTREYFPQSAVWPAPDLKGGPDRAAPNVSSQARFLRISPRSTAGTSGVRIFRGSPEPVAPAPLSATSGVTVIRLKKPPRNPYKTVIVYAPGSVRTISPRRIPD
ncbi:hypothetical protein [Hyphomonas johnsonii]|jgi:hypothetical protein|uniref:Lipoprotein n=1 Tax=Hyphomonas johnsonii MHS-2 TaxID=1280950 RepID=A0A059FP04_9PROT|nr:hypothetical protein [Hyphomonas johnsonii]KCZ92400.1 hypothetical protein HJO_10204 [Hyphomonas johnsonii MHS-2]